MFILLCNPLIYCQTHKCWALLYFWKSEKERLYFDSQDTLYNPLEFYTPRTTTSVSKERSHMSRRFHFVSRLLKKIWSQKLLLG